MDVVMRRLANTDNSDQLLLAYIAIQVATNLSGPICDGDINYGLQELTSADQSSLSLNKDLAELGWSHKMQELLNRKNACRKNKYSYEAAIYRLEKAKKGPSSCEERKEFEQLATKVAESDSKLESYLDEQASVKAAESVFQNMVNDMKGQKTATQAKAMTIERANEITNGIEAILAAPDRVLVGRQFKPISATGASTRLEIAHALYIVTAQVFKAVSASPDQAATFATFVRGVGSSRWHVLWLQPCLPDSELHLIAKLHKETKAFWTESIRLSELAQKDGLMEKLETIDSFVSYLGTLSPNGVDYWPKVYERIGLDCPTELMPRCS